MKHKKIDPARLVFVFLLAVMLDHTAYFFAQFEPVDSAVSIMGFSIGFGRIKGFAMALVFELSIWIMTEKLAAHMETIRTRRANFRQRFQTFVDRFINAYGLALGICWTVSFVANYSHALQFGNASTVAKTMGIDVGIAALFAGGVLPFVSLLFSSAIAKTTLAETDSDSTVDNLRSELATVKKQLATANNKIGPAAVLVDKSANGTDKILAAVELWPNMPNNGLAILAGVSPSHVTKTIQRKGLTNGRQ